jgi:capsular polysaccharide export protein
MRILLLQGPVGGFFDFLSSALSRAGCDVKRVVFNGGDQFFSSAPGRIIYRGTLSDWPAELRSILEDFGPDALIAFGDERPVHRFAKIIADEFGIPVWFFEEGYIRPSYVTFEKGGNNANSPLSAYADRPLSGWLPPAPVIKGVSKRMAWNAAVYFSIMHLMKPFFRNYIHHRNRKPLNEALCWLVSFYRSLRERSRDKAVISSLLSSGAPPFNMVALQVHDDLQLRSHGRFWSNGAMIDFVLQSFARHAPVDRILVFKVHPLARGHYDHADHIRHTAAALAVSDRVKVLISGSVAPLVRGSRGLITINSTVGIVALRSGVPVALLGKALYGLSPNVFHIRRENDLTEFWRAASSKHAEHSDESSPSILNAALIGGSFYLPATWPQISSAVLAKLIRDLRKPLEVNADPAPASKVAAE